MKAHFWLVATSVVLSACSTGPQVTYSEASKRDLASPEKRETFFALSGSNVFLVPTATDDKKKVDLTGTKDVCADVHEHTSKEAAKACLDNVSAFLAPYRKTDKTYVIHAKYGTTLNVKSVGEDPLLPQTIEISYKNPAIEFISGAGTNAVAGYAIAGPWGAVFGVVSEVIVTSRGYRSNGTKFSIQNEKFSADLQGVCKGIDVTKVSTSLSLKLPVLIPYPLSTQEEDETTACWRPLPRREQEDTKDTTLSGWFYRFTWDGTDGPGTFPPSVNQARQADSPWIISREDFLKYPPTNTTTNVYPVTACRAVVLEVVWWENLRAGLKKSIDGDPAIPDVKQLSMKIADTDFIQLVKMPWHGTVNVLPTCGAYATNTEPSSTSGDVVSELLKAGADLKKEAGK